MENEYPSHDVEEIKQAHSIITNINPEDEETSRKYGRYPDPSTYEMNQSLFTRQELFGQTGFAILFENEELYFGGMYKGMKHGLGVQLTRETVY